MLVKILDETFRVKFTHFTDRENPGTTCEIFKLGQEDLDPIMDNPFYMVGDTFLNTKLDHFDKAVGRKLALQRAIENFPRSYRILFWKEYWRQHAK